MEPDQKGTTTELDLADLSDAELERLQQEEDGELQADETTTDATQGADGTDAAAAAAAKDTDTAADKGKPEGEQAKTETAAATSAGAETGKAGKPEGVQSKDGSRVLPYAALQAERRAARAASARAERAEKELATAKQQIEDLKSGKAPIADLTEEEVQQMEADFPAQGKKLRALWEKAQAAPTGTTDKGSDTPDDDDPALRTQELIDQVPMLLEWQHNDPEKFQRAIAVDAVYTKSPKWVGKDPLDRFEAVARFVADEYGIEYEPGKTKTSDTAAATTQPAKSPAASAAPAAALKEPERRQPETLSDFKTGGSTPDHGSIDIRGSNPRALLDKFMGMSDQDIDAQLARLG
jgi:hypothetical protein